MSEMKPYKYLFSFVVPIYNVEPYLDEMVESLLAQSIGFTKNCEIIFVNDGSTDGSEAICMKYKKLYPDNITYILQKNQGPGEARNKGFAAAQGKYISPIDADDKISRETLQEVYRFFEAHYEEIDVIGIKWELFGARKGPHPLNGKFTTSRIIDLEKEYASVQSSVAPAFFKSEALKMYRFDPSVGRYAEDGRFMGEFLMKKKRYGVVVKPTYYYRKRVEQTSSQDLNKKDKFWYLETPKRAWMDLFRYAKKHNNGVIPKYVQYLVMYDLQWRFVQASQDVLSPTEEQDYRSLLYRLLSDIDDDIIVNMPRLNIDRKLFLLNKKHSTNILERSVRKGYAYYYNGTPVYDISQDIPAVHIEILECTKDSIVIEGYYSGYLVDEATLDFTYAGQTYSSQEIEKNKRITRFLSETVIARSRFKVTFPLTEESKIVAKPSNESEPSLITLHRFAYMNRKMLFSYRTDGRWIIIKQPTFLQVKPYTVKSHIVTEFRYLMRIAKRLRLQVFIAQFKLWWGIKTGRSGIMPTIPRWYVIPFKNFLINTYSITFRLVYYVLAVFKREKVWLLSDRVMAADDSGEILFRYLMKQNNLPAKAYFTISKDSDEAKQLRQYGPTLHFGGLRHKLLFLLSDKIISSEATDAIINIFGNRLDDFVDLYTFDFVFLQHGIIRDDISGWLNRYNKNIKLFVTSTQDEYRSIIEGNYGYDHNVVKLTGLPRYDMLQNEPQDKIIIMPTWRDNLAGPVDFKTGIKQYNPYFRQSEYYRFFNDLMNNAWLLEAMKAHNLKGEFFIHPSFQQQTHDFLGNDTFTIMEMPHNYPKAKSEARLLITDYSSVAFDFAYLKKPVIYTQFDNDTFYNMHTSRAGYFDYQTDGFGPTIYNLEDTVASIVNVINKDFAMEPKYIRRVDRFFAFNDKKNSKRVYKAILALDNGEN